MKVLIDKTFKKDTDKVKDSKVKIRLAGTIRSIQEVHDFTELRNIKKLKGSQSFYRIRIGEL